ncbi:hypothetical protein [Sphingobium ummariense]|uniref:Uncharacterized protein n=1 Tax=Sphingobium ummariense RL-3 TaxID=1346791 RepID=T0KHH6_9SPHN|nr:hypothetical protein [Sphingobium ummariense]EQB32703.1 hypothetical protein M529_07655 [Sphingobium ummariense RL-3]
MPFVPKILLGAYLLFLVAAGWRLFGIAWSRRIKVATGLSLVVPLPLLFLLPALLRPREPFADLLLALGLALLVCGMLCLAAGMAIAWLRARRA